MIMIYDIDTAKKLVVQAGKDLMEKGLIARTWGNISARISETEFVITPSGRAYETLTPDQLVTVRIKDAGWEGDIRPSSEKNLHAGIYRLKKDAGFLIHTHQSFASALGVLGKDIVLSGIEERFASEKEKIALGSRVPCAGYGLSSTKTLARKVTAAVRREPDAKAVLMPSHGVLCIGWDQPDAYEIADSLEAVSRRLFEEYYGKNVPIYAGKREDVQLSDSYMIHTRTPFVMEMSRVGKTMRPYIDDLAQIAGTSIRCVKKGISEEALEKALRGRDAVLVKDDGAFCFGKNKDEAEALCIVLEKSCMAAVLGKKNGAKPVGRIPAMAERRFYTKKYAAQKDENV